MNTASAPRGPIVIHLTHEVYCAAAGDCRCKRDPVLVEVFDEAKKKRVKSTQNKRLPHTITLSAAGTEGDSIEGLHPAVLKTEDGARFLAARQIKWVEMKPVEAPAEAAPQPPTSKDAAPTPAPIATSRPRPPRGGDASPPPTPPVS